MRNLKKNSDGKIEDGPKEAEQKEYVSDTAVGLDHYFVYLNPFFFFSIRIYISFIQSLFPYK